MTDSLRTFDAVTVTLNPAIDRTVKIPDFTAGKVNRVEEVWQNPGGKGVNVASALSDHGHRVAVTGFLGRNNTETFEALFAGKGITDRFVHIEGHTRIGIKITDPVRNETTDINFPGPAPTPGDLTLVLEQLAGFDAKWFVLAGSLPPGVDETFYRDLTTRLKGRGGKVAVDTSGVPLTLALEAGPNLIKPNIHELEELLGAKLNGEIAVTEAARQLVARGIELVVVSMGREGACYVTADESLVACPPNIEVGSTVGAGDAMVAGTVAGRLRGLSLSDCARMGTAFSMEALMRGAPGTFAQASIEILMAEVSIRKPSTS